MRTSPTSKSLTVLIALLTGVGILLPRRARPQAGPDRATRWARPPPRQLHPGVQAYTARRPVHDQLRLHATRAGRVYLGYAAHCAGKGEATDTDGCRTTSHPIGTRVRFAEGGIVADGGTTVGHGRLAYSSWITMRKLGAGRNACAANDFALVARGQRGPAQGQPERPDVGWTRRPVDRRAPARGRRSTPTASPACARPRCSRRRPARRSGRRTAAGAGTSTPPRPASRATPAAASSTQDGRAVGTLSTVAIAPLAGSNGLGDLASELRYAQRHSGIKGLRLVPGTEPFSPLL